MPRQNFSSKLPKDVKQELDARIRESHYCLQTEHANWLLSKGHSTSKSAMNRYSRALMKADNVQTNSSVELSATAATDRGHLTPREQILMQLGELRLQENELIQQLLNVSGQDGQIIEKETDDFTSD